MTEPGSGCARGAAARARLGTHGQAEPCSLRARHPGPRPTRPTPEQFAKTVTDKRPSPPRQPEKVEIILEIVLPRALAERVSARAIRETREVEALIAEILVAADMIATAGVR